MADAARRRGLTGAEVCGRADRLGVHRFHVVGHDHVDGQYRFEVLEGVSHWIPEEAPAVLTGLLLEHLASASASGGPGRPEAQ